MNTPRPRGRLLGDAPQQLWTLPVHNVWACAPVLDGGTLFYGDNEGKNAALHAVDIQTGAVLWQARVANATLVTPLVACGGMVYGGSQDPTQSPGPNSPGALLAFDTSSRRLAWEHKGHAVVSEPVVSNGQVFFGDVRGYLYGVDATTGAVVFQATSAGVSDTDEWDVWPAAVSGSSVIFSVSKQLAGLGVSGRLYAFSTGGTPVWSRSFDSLACGAPLAAAGLVYLGGTDGTVRAIDPATGDDKWTFSASGPVTSRPAYAGGILYVGALSGDFYALDGNTGTLIWSLSTGGCIEWPVTVAEGVAYFALGGDTQAFYAVDVATQVPLSFTPGGSSVLASPTSWNGVAYLMAGGFFGGTLYALRLQQVLKELYAQCELMVEGYDTSGTKPQPSTTSYRTTVALFDADKSPLPREPLKLWASGPVTLQSNGQSYAIDVNTPIWLQSSASGELDFTLEATSLMTPTLYLWASFMLADESIVLYPNTGALNRLSTLQAADLDPARAVGYDGTPILLPQYQSQDQRESIAKMIRNTVGRQNTASSAAASTSRYLAFPASTPALAYLPPGGAAARPFAPNDIPSFTVRFSDSGVTFTEGASITSDALGSFDDFMTDVVLGGADALSCACGWVEGKIEALIHAAEKAYRFVVETVEHAIAVLVGLLKKVLATIELIIQWLSWLFEWKDILHTHDVINDSLKAALTSVQTWADQTVGSGMSAVNSFFQTLESGIDSAFDSVEQMLGSTAFSDARSGFSNPSQAYGAGGAKAYVPTRWVQGKVMDGLSGALARARAAPVRADSVTAAWNTFITTATNTLGSEFTGLVSKAAAMASQLEGLLTTPEDFMRTSVVDVLEIVRVVVKDVLRFANAIADAFLTLLRDALGALLDSLTSDTIDIPVLSDIYRLITGDKLTYIDVLSLLAAVPTTIVAKQLGLWNSTQTVADATDRILPIAYTFMYGAYGLVDPASDADGLLEGPLKHAYVAAGLAVTGLGIPRPVKDAQVHDWLLWGAQFVPAFLAYAPSPGQEASRGRLGGDENPWDLVTTVYGAGMAGAYVGYAAAWPDGYMGDDGLTLIENLFSVVPYIGKIGKWFEVPGFAVTITLDIIGDFTACIMSRRYWAA